MNGEAARFIHFFPKCCSIFSALTPIWSKKWTASQYFSCAASPQEASHQQLPGLNQLERVGSCTAYTSDATHISISSDVVGTFNLIILLQKQCCDPSATLPTFITIWCVESLLPMGHNPNIDDMRPT